MARIRRTGEISWPSLGLDIPLTNYEQLRLINFATTAPVSLEARLRDTYQPVYA
jgi:hypothetical protein